MTKDIRTETASNIINLAGRQWNSPEGGRPHQVSRSSRPEAQKGRGTMTPLNDAEAQLAKALARFEEIGISLDPRVHLKEEHEPLSKKQRKATVSAAIAVKKAAMAVAQIAHDSVGALATHAGRAHLSNRVANMTIINVMMCDIVRIVEHANNPYPVAVAGLISLAHYLAGIMPAPGGGRPPEHRDEGEVADFFAPRQVRRAA
jgi:hypothetical protein